jgi:hypothetical protein
MDNPKILITAGCSFTQYPKDRFHNWPGFLSQYLNCEPSSYFLGVGSADNSYIANTTLHTLSTIDKNDYDRIIVGVMWSGINRMSFFLTEKPDDYDDNKIEYNPIGYMNNNYYFVGPKWNGNLAKIYYKNFYDEIGSIIQTLKNMLLVQNFLKLNNIKYFFTEYSYDSVSSNQLRTHPEVEFFYDLLDKSHFLPVQNMSHWIDNNTKHKYFMNDFHPTPLMSRDFTYKVIIPYLKNRGYIE